ncbi:MAG: hypothetical protein JWP31_2698 [Aeromicrobium sp.]|nr:hypothetical protein [Aeromicrobium sp.]
METAERGSLSRALMAAPTSRKWHEVVDAEVIDQALVHERESTP